MNSYCAHCPNASNLIKCSCSNPGMGAFCLSLAAGNSSYTEIIVEASRAGVATIEDFTAFMESRHAKFVEAESAPMGSDDLPIDDMKIGREVVRCKHRVKPACGCPGNPHTCTHPGKSGEKWYLDCYQCKLSEIRSG